MKRILLYTTMILMAASSALAQDKDMFKVKREAVFEFAAEPVVTRKGNDFTITFESKAFCDATVAIEDSNGKIVRHLACGVLGDNAPPPFQPNTKKQKIVWDGKDDAGRYLKTPEAATVRVSLGLKPRFERTLFWHPGKGAGGVLAFAPSPEGVFVFLSGRAVDHLRMFDHDGNYVRTVYPFPHKKLDSIPDLIRHRFPDGKRIPIKPNWLQSSMLMSGSNCTDPTYKDGKYRGYRHRGTEMNGAAGYDIAVAGKRIALVGDRYSRISTDGSSGGLKLHASATLAFELDKARKWDQRRGIDESRLAKVRPKKVEFSPDGKWMYLTMYNETHAGSFGHVAWRHAVMRKRYADDSPPEIFVGGEKAGSEDGQLNMPSDVACDSRGRVYVADHSNDRVAVFDVEGKHLKNIPVKRPAQIDVDPDTGEIYVFCWALPKPGEAYYGGTHPTLPRKRGGEGQTYFVLRKFSAIDNAKELESWNLHKLLGLRLTGSSNVEYATAMDFHADPITLWINAPSPVGARKTKGRGIVVMALENGNWTVKRDMLQDAARAIKRVRPAMFNRQRLYVNPTDGMLYLAEGQEAYGKEFFTIYQIDPETGRVRKVELPLGAEDMAFDQEGFAYLLTSGLLMRYQSDSWREVPFDYGEERKRHTFSEGRLGPVISGAVFHARIKRNQGGMHVAPDGRIVIGARYPVNLKDTRRKGEMKSPEDAYQPTLYPGRRAIGIITLVQILDRHGKMVMEDALPGLHQQIDGTAIDNRGDIYIHTAQPIMINGKEHFNDHAGTLMKFTPGKSRLLGTSGTPVPLTNPPDRAPDLARPKAWVEGAHWMYAGVGWGGHNYSSGCACPSSRFALDYFARSFTPEIDRYNVGVVDRNGNLILRVGQCGNVDEGMPLEKAGGPPNPRSIGGDETALFYAPYVATHTDRRLFVADPGNARVVSVKLGYHEEKKIRLQDVAE